MKKIILAYVLCLCAATLSYAEEVKSKPLSSEEQTLEF